VAWRALQILAIAAVGWIVLRLVSLLSLIVVPILLGVVLACATWPLARSLQLRGVPNAIAALATVLALIMSLGLLGWIVVDGVYAERDELIEGAWAGLAELEDLIVAAVPWDSEEVSELRDELVGQANVTSLREQAALGAVFVGEVMMGLVLTIVIVFFLLKDGARFWTQVRDQLTPRRQRARMQRIGTATLDVLGGFIRGTTVVAAVDAIVIGVGLVLLGVPLALPLAIVIFLTAYIPIAGATLAGALAALVALVSVGPITALLVVALVIAVNQIEGNILAPVVLGRAVNLHPLAVLLSIVAGFVLAGIIGALLAVPVFAATWAAINSWDDRDDEPLDPEPAPDAGLAAPAGS
jgi:putative heme transporter